MLLNQFPVLTGNLLKRLICSASAGSRRRSRVTRSFHLAAEIFEQRLVLSNSTGTVLINETFEDGTIDGFDEVALNANAAIATGDSYGPGNKAYQITYENDEFGAILSKHGLTVESIDVSFASKLPDGIPLVMSVRKGASVRGE